VSRLLAIAVLLVGGCSLLPQSMHPPQACIDVYSADRCLAMTDRAAAEVGANRADVSGIAIIPGPPAQGATSGGGTVWVRIALNDGSTHDTGMCGGIPRGPACADDPRLESRSPISSYTDVPAGSTALPTVTPSAKRSASTLVVESVTIPIEKEGEYEVVLGEGALPNGVWTIGSFGFAEPWPDDLALREGVATLELRSLEPGGKPFDNYYLHGWRPGVERFKAVLLFEVLWFEPGAELAIQNVVVR
jgi:hypothetical protein